MPAVERAALGLSGNTWLARSGQGWKLAVSVGSQVVGLTFFFGALHAPAAASDNQVALLALAGLGVCLGGFSWAALSLRCAACRARLLWRAMRTRRAGEWLTWLRHLPACPACGCEGGSARDTRPAPQRV